MVLDELHALIETLQSRIDEHAPALQQSEALTRYALIDPLLRALAWDTGDPAQVLVEYRSSAGSADYALLGADGKPKIIVEAKRLGTPLQAVATQGINYCVQSGVPYFALTDGRHWELYETFRPVPLEEKVVVTLDLESPVVETCLNAMALWRPSAAGTSIRRSAKPVVELQVVTPHSEAPSDLGLPADRDQVEPDDSWLLLSDFAPQAGVKPSAVRFPDGHVANTTNWADFITGIVEWLQANNRLTGHQVPIRLANQKQYIVNTSPEHRDSFYREVGPWFVRTNYTGGQHAQNARGLIKLAELDPDDFAVKLR